MVDKSWRQGVKVEVAHTIRTYYHCCLLFTESINNVLQGVLVGIEVVGVELNSETSTTGVVDSIVPTATDAEVETFRSDYNKAVALLLKGAEYLCCSIGRVILNDNNIKGERCLLAQSALYSIADGLLTIEDGDDDTRLDSKLLLVEVGSDVIRWGDEGTNLAEVSCYNTLHLHLYLTILRIYIVELFLTTLAEVVLLFGI